MTDEIKSRILELRDKGSGYKTIAKATGCSVDSVKGIIRRNNNQCKNTCLQCGKKLVYIPHKKKKKFCSDMCRMKWWNANPEIVHRSSESRTCMFCGKDFQASRKNTRFCSRACYAESRKKVVK